MRRHWSILLLAICLVLVPAHAQNKDLLSQYAGKVLIQRQFIAGPHPLYDADGKVLAGDMGPWSTSAEVEVRHVRTDGNSLLIEGRRLFLIYDDGTKQFRDVFDLLANTSDARRLFPAVPKKKQLEDLRHEQPVTIEIRHAGGWDEAAVAAAMKHVFLAPNEYLSDIAPEMWRDLLCRIERASGRIFPCTPTAGPIGEVFKVGNGVTAPRAKYTPDPEYSNAARQADYQGTTVLWLIVSREGRPEHIKIARAIGLGLDEKAVDAVSGWEFAPASKDGQPVDVQINVEVNFRLY